MALDQNERPISFDLMNSHSAHLLLLRGHECTCGTADSSLCQANKEQIQLCDPRKLKKPVLMATQLTKKHDQQVFNLQAA